MVTALHATTEDERASEARAEVTPSSPASRSLRGFPWLLLRLQPPVRGQPLLPFQRLSTTTAASSVGAIPRALPGSYLRNSSTPRSPPKGRYHWFDGDGMLQAVHLEDGRASFRNRWIRTRAFLAESEAGGALWSGVRWGYPLPRSG